MDDEVVGRTRRSLHAVGELVIAGPQHRRHGTIRLRATPGGFAGVALAVAVRGLDLVWDGGSATLTGRSCRDLATAAGLDAGAPEDLYDDTSGVDLDEPLVVDRAAAELLTGWLTQGQAALRAFAPEIEPVLWPEHFDLAITVDHDGAGGVNYGVSVGDAAHPQPYAYIGPWTPRQGAFWNAPFGAIRPATDLVDDGATAAFFASAAEHL